MLQGLYGITDIDKTPYNRVEFMVEEALKGGMKILQLRDKQTPTSELLPLAKVLQSLCSQFGATFIVDDNIDLVEQCDADGLHIGKDDMPLTEARKRLPNKIIGVSCYGKMELAHKAQSEGATYIAFGSFFPSPTKPKAPVVPGDILIQAKNELKIPVCSIGGITSENASVLIEKGADMVSVIHDLWVCEDIREKALAYQKLFINEKSPRP